MKEIRVLVIDDEPEISGLISKYMKLEGYTADLAANGDKALRLFENNSYSLVVADIMMPGPDGYEVCEKIREISDVPIIFISAKHDEVDKLLGFKAGADDYVTKPFSINELMARCRASLKRYLPLKNEASDEIAAGPIIINSSSARVTKNGEELNLRAKELKILILLASNRGKVFSRQSIFNHIWDEDGMESDENTVTVHIRRLREKVEEHPESPALIKTVWGLGYKFAENNEIY